MEYQNLTELRSALDGIVETSPVVKVLDENRLVSELIDRLIYTSVFASESETRDAARWIIREAGRSLGVFPASIHELYMARGRGELSGFTVPAINIRGMTYDVARAVFRAASDLETGALIFEIARSEIGYTQQRPAEYAASVMAAAIKEGFRGPLFIQGDHFQVNAKKYGADPEGELNAVKDIIKEGIEAGFYNIDIDASTLVDLSKPNLEEQQRVNFELSSELTELVRSLEPAGVTVSVGAEIGEVGGQNSTVEELQAFMDGYNATLNRKGELIGISKISVQSGTTHGGVVLPDGSVADVKIDFDTLRSLSETARNSYKISGAVQHGASTLPDEAFDNFPKTETSEVHLATAFQNSTYEHELFPADLRDKIYAHLSEACAGERKPDQTDEQFYYKTRKKGFGPFKAEIWGLPEQVRDGIGKTLEDKFKFLFTQLNVGQTRKMVTDTVSRIDVPSPRPDGF